MSRRGQWVSGWISGEDRSVTPVIATILIVALVVVIAASFGAVAFGFTERLGGTSVSANNDQCLQSVDFDPNDVDSFADSATADLDCVLWFDATQESFSNAQKVDVWADRSGNGFDATSSAEAGVSAPEYREDVDGVSAIKFEDDGGIEGLDTDANASEIGLEGTQPFTTTAVVRPGPDGQGAILQQGVESGGTAWGFQTDMPNDQWLFQVSSGYGELYFVKYDGSDDDRNWFVITHVYDGDSISIYKDGEPIWENGKAVAEDAEVIVDVGETDGSSIDVTDTPFNIGFFNWNSPENGLNGYVAEIVVLNEAFDDTDRKVLECTLDEKHGSAVDVDGC